MRSPCRNCRGEGYIINSPCHSCRGLGRTLQTKRGAINIPAGRVFHRTGVQLILRSCDTN